MDLCILYASRGGASEDLCAETLPRDPQVAVGELGSGGGVVKSSALDGHRRSDQLGRPRKQGWE